MSKVFYKRELLVEELNKHRFNFNKIPPVGDLIEIEFGEEINHHALMKKINKQPEIFHISAFYMYTNGEILLFDCVDLSSGDNFFLQIKEDRCFIRMNKDSRTEFVVFFFTNLKKLHPGAVLKVDEIEYILKEPRQKWTNTTLFQ